MGFRSVKEYIDAAYRDGKFWSGMWRRTAPYNSPSNWTDLSYGGGGPMANYYASAPGVCQYMAAQEGIQHGPNVSPGTKHLKSIMFVGGSAVGIYHMTLLDYIWYVPFLDGDLDSEQTWSPLSLPRYTDGVGVRLMLVGQGAGTGASYFTLRYTNQYDQERITTWGMNRLNLGYGAGALILGSNAATFGNQYINLYPGDFPKIVSGLQLVTPVGGIFALIAVKPIANIGSRDATVSPMEIDFPGQRLTMPVVPDGAYLNFIGCGVTAANPAHYAQLDFVWS